MWWLATEPFVPDAGPQATHDNADNAAGPSTGAEDVLPTCHGPAHPARVRACEYDLHYNYPLAFELPGSNPLVEWY